MVSTVSLLTTSRSQNYKNLLEMRVKYISRMIRSVKVRSLVHMFFGTDGFEEHGPVRSVSGSVKSGGTVPKNIGPKFRTEIRTNLGP